MRSAEGQNPSERFVVGRGICALGGRSRSGTAPRLSDAHVPLWHRPYTGQDYSHRKDELTLQETAAESVSTTAVGAASPRRESASEAGPVAIAVADAVDASQPSADQGGGGPIELTRRCRDTPLAALVPGQGGRSNRLCVGHWLDTEP